MKRLVSNIDDVERLVELLARSKAVWIDPELRNLVVMASSPSSAYKMIYEKVGKEKKAKAAHKLAQAVRDYDPLLVRSCIRYMECARRCDPKELKQYLLTTLQ